MEPIYRIVDWMGLYVSETETHSKTLSERVQSEHERFNQWMICEKVSPKRWRVYNRRTAMLYGIDPQALALI